MPIDYIVEQGECIDSIALEHGFFPETIWNDSANSQLKSSRKDSNILYAGDLVKIPDKRLKEESGATERKHRFKRKGVPAKLQIQLLDEGQPRADLEYVLKIDGTPHRGVTDSEGWIRQSISPIADEAELLVEGETPVILHFSHLDPIDTASGSKARLRNLGFHVGAIDDEHDDRTQAAVRAFQRKHELEETGNFDEPTRGKLKEIHGS